MVVCSATGRSTAKDWRQGGYGFCKGGEADRLNPTPVDRAGIGTLIAGAVFVEISSDLKCLEVTLS